MTWKLATSHYVVAACVTDNYLEIRLYLSKLWIMDLVVIGELSILHSPFQF